MRYDLSAPGERKTSNLELHPLNKQVYGDCIADPALIASVKKNGIFNPIIVNEDGVILSGTRRWAAAKLVGLDKVPTIRFMGKDSLTEELFLIESNRQRIKTEAQKDAEAAALLRIETELAKERQRQGKTSLADPASGGRAVDKVASVTGESAANIQKRVKIHEANIDPAERNQQSTHAAYNEVSNREKCRRAYVQQHPEYLGKPNREIDSQINRENFSVVNRETAPPQPSLAPCAVSEVSESTAQLRESFNGKYKAFKLSPCEQTGRYDLTLFSLTDQQVKMIGDMLGKQ